MDHIGPNRTLQRQKERAGVQLELTEDGWPILKGMPAELEACKHMVRQFLKLTYRESGF